jgi:hypothetical protein
VATIAELLLERRLERVGVDRDEAEALLEHAQSHLRSAAKIMDDDAPGAYQLAYDAARKAVAAHMAANGYRAKSDRAGSHAAVVAYAEEALADEAREESLQHFDRMRRVRNRIEYGGVTVGRSQVDNDLAHAKEIVRAAAASIG